MIFCAIGFSIIFYFTFSVIKNRYFNEVVSPSIAPSPAEINQIADDDTSLINPDAPASNADDLDEENDTSVEPTPQLEVTRKDCDNNCKRFTLVDDVKYCKNFCGLDTEKNKRNGCDEWQDIKKDYCLKQEAIDTKNMNICSLIADPAIKKSCQNRITEDTL